VSPTLVSIGQVDADRNNRRNLWRMLTPENIGPAGATAGVATYHPRADATSGPPPLGAAHERAEIYFVLEGTGLLHTPDDALPLSAGDAFIVPAGTPHTIEGTDGASVRTFYVSLKGPAA
jgi:mannose-6-phosphate isomerase-like protein (cupin superfamily)